MAMQEYMLAAMTGAGIKGVVMPICASVFMCALAIKAVKLSFDDDFSKKLAFAAGAVFSALFVFIPDTATKVVVDLAKVAIT
ncbi:hypothetical protein [Streptomyces sp. NPDC059533]|uniref:hypothetical protein n=1 Tax=unclassified Streptomyces TaxID=2593676 RepID=UPI0036A32CA2